MEELLDAVVVIVFMIQAPVGVVGFVCVITFRLLRPHGLHEFIRPAEGLGCGSFRADKLAWTVVHSMPPWHSVPIAVVGVPQTGWPRTGPSRWSIRSSLLRGPDTGSAPNA